VKPQVTEYRPDLDEKQFLQFEKGYTPCPNPKGLQVTTGKGVFESIEAIFNDGGQFASQADRVGRDVPLSGSAVEADFVPGRADCFYTRIKPNTWMGILKGKPDQAARRHLLRRGQLRARHRGLRRHAPAQRRRGMETGDRLAEETWVPDMAGRPGADRGP